MRPLLLLLGDWSRLFDAPENEGGRGNGSGDETPPPPFSRACNVLPPTRFIVSAVPSLDPLCSL